MATAPRARSLRIHHLLLLLTIASLAMVSCMRTSHGVSDLDAIKRPAPSRQPSPTVATIRVPMDAPATYKGPVDQDASWYRPRSSWSAQQIDTSNIEPMQPIYRLTVHHSGDAEDATGIPADHLRQFERAHKDKGWACIGYHFVIARDGTVYEARPIKYQGAHATGENNFGNIGICLMGNFDSRPIPIAQRKALENAVSRLKKKYGIASKELYGHRDFKTTDCPGRYVMSWLEAYKGD